MKNLSHFKESPLDFFDEVLKSKRNSKIDLTYKDRIILLRPNVLTKMIEYDDSFFKNKLTEINQFGYIDPAKKDLIKLYSFKNKKLKSLRITLTTTEHNRIINTCQNCTINEITSFDHLLPKEEFPEYSIHPKNLFPSCVACNGYKNIKWRHNGQPLFLNLYLDPLPLLQYLFVDIIITPNSISTNFYINNTNNIPIILYNIIESHYIKLHLLERFNLNSHDIIVELKNTIISQKNDLSKTKIKSIITNNVTRNRDAFGFNYWKSILTLELINNAVFMDPLFKK